MKTRTTRFVGPGRLEIWERDLPPLAPRQVLIRVRACGLCTWEQRFYQGVAPESYPFLGGHEVAGEVIALGSEAAVRAAPGDPVCLALKTRCGACFYCRRGMDNLCENEDRDRRPGRPWGPAGLSDYVIAEDYQVYPVAPGRDFALLTLAEPLACVLRSVAGPPLETGDAVLVQGAGVMGMLHLLLLRQQGMRVLVAEPRPDRRRQALAAGAELALDPAEGLEAALDGRHLRAVFFTGGGAAAIRQVLPLLDKGGWLCLYGSVHPSAPVAVDPNLVHYRELVVTGTYSHTRASFRRAAALLSLGQMEIAPLISERVPFPDLERGFARATAGDAYRVVMTF